MIQPSTKSSHDASNACPLCESRDTDCVHIIAGAGEQPELRACGKCRLTFINPANEQRFETIPLEAYMNDWDLLDLSGLAFLYDWLTDSVRLYAGHLKNHLNSERRLLDVGCGGGYFIAHCRAQGWQVAGIEPWRALAVWSRKYLRLEVEPKRLADSELPEKSFEVVVAHDVIQFSSEPVQFLEQCRRLLVPGGLLLVTTPNFDCTKRKLVGWAWDQIRPMAHLVYFNADTLAKASAHAGLKMHQIEVRGGEGEDEQLMLVAQRFAEPEVSWADISEPIEDTLLPPLDRNAVDEATLSKDQRSWCDQGYVILRNFIPESLVDRYCAVRERIQDPLGWHHETPYLEVAEIRDLCLYSPLTERLAHLLGEPLGLHLNLTGWVSTERDWHQDDYLNPPEIMSRYAAVWFALDDIAPESGPFEFVPGSHRWPLITREKMLNQIPSTSQADKHWPWHTQRLLTPFFEREIERRRAGIEKFLAGKGDVLIWHSRLVHRGSPPRREGAGRKAIIAHYSGIERHLKGRRHCKHNTGGYYFVFGSDQYPRGSGRWLGRLRSNLRRLKGN